MRPRHLFTLAAVTALLAVPVQAQAAGPARTYQVAPWGNDKAHGSPTSPLRTIGACLDRVRPGDTCLIHHGTYREQVTPPSGTKDAPITLAAYGDGPVTVDGTEKVTGWKDAGDGLVAADTDLPPDPDFNAVFLDNERAAEGRWPNSGSDPLNTTWAEADLTSTDQHIDDTDLPDADWTGATVHLWAGSNPWAQQTGTVTATAPGKLDFKGGNYRCRRCAWATRTTATTTWWAPRPPWTSRGSGITTRPCTASTWSRRRAAWPGTRCMPSTVCGAST
jgi:hypothetical protein